MGVDKEALSGSCTKTLKGNFLKSDFTSLSTFKAELLSHCSSTVTYDVSFSSRVSTFIQCKKHNFKCCYIRPSRAGRSHVIKKEGEKRPENLRRHVLSHCMPVRSLRLSITSGYQSFTLAQQSKAWAYGAKPGVRLGYSRSHSLGVWG